jgi:hypothetical protein
MWNYSAFVSFAQEVAGDSEASRKVVEPMIERLPGNGDAETASVGEVGLAAPPHPRRLGQLPARVQDLRCRARSEAEQAADASKPTGSKAFGWGLGDSCPAIPREGEAREAKQHHSPCRRLGDARRDH